VKRIEQKSKKPKKEGRGNPFPPAGARVEYRCKGDLQQKIVEEKDLYLTRKDHASGKRWKGGREGETVSSYGAILQQQDNRINDRQLKEKEKKSSFDKFRGRGTVGSKRGRHCCTTNRQDVCSSGAVSKNGGEKGGHLGGEGGGYGTKPRRTSAAR